MATKVQYRPTEVPAHLERLSRELRRISPAEAETLALLIEPEARKTIRRSLQQAKAGRVRELRS